MTSQKKTFPEYLPKPVSEPNGPDDLVPSVPLAGIGLDKRFDPDRFEEVCGLMASGKKIEEIFSDKTSYSAFAIWLSQNPDMKPRWEDAKEMKALVLMTESIDIVDGKMDDTRTDTNPTGKDPNVLNGVLIQSRDLRARTRIAVANALLKRMEDKQPQNTQVGVIIGWGNQQPK